MKEYAFTKWLVPTLQADGTKRDMVYNEQMGIFTVRGENQFQKEVSTHSIRCLCSY